MSLDRRGGRAWLGTRRRTEGSHAASGGRCRGLDRRLQPGRTQPAQGRRPFSQDPVPKALETPGMRGPGGP